MKREAPSAVMESETLMLEEAGRPPRRTSPGVGIPSTASLRGSHLASVQTLSAMEGSLSQNTALHSLSNIRRGLLGFTSQDLLSR